MAFIFFIDYLLPVNLHGSLERVRSAAEGTSVCERGTEQQEPTFSSVSEVEEDLRAFHGLLFIVK